MKDPIIIREKGSGTKKEMDIFLEKLGITSSDLNVIARMNDLESIKKFHCERTGNLHSFHTLYDRSTKNKADPSFST